MKQILCFGDSNTWGLDGETGKRFPWEERWTGILQEKLADRDIRIVEEGLCGRTTIFEDPLRLGRRGTELLPTLLETHTPDAVVERMTAKPYSERQQKSSEKELPGYLNRLISMQIR